MTSGKIKNTKLKLHDGRSFKMDMLHAHSLIFLRYVLAIFHYFGYKIGILRVSSI